MPTVWLWVDFLWMKITFHVEPSPCFWGVLTPFISSLFYEATVVFVHRWIASLTLYLVHRRQLDCPGGVLLSTYLIVLLVLLAVIICTVLAMVCVSMRGKEPRFLWETWFLSSRPFCNTIVVPCSSPT